MGRRVARERPKRKKRKSTCGGGKLSKGLDALERWPCWRGKQEKVGAWSDERTKAWQPSEGEKKKVEEEGVEQLPFSELKKKMEAARGGRRKKW